MAPKSLNREETPPREKASRWLEERLREISCDTSPQSARDSKDEQPSTTVVQQLAHRLEAVSTPQQNQDNSEKLLQHYSRDLGKNPAAAFSKAMELIQSGVNVTTDAGKQLLMHAAWHGDVDAMKALIKQGADVNAKVGGETPLHTAMLNGQLEAVSILLEQGANRGIKNARNETVLESVASCIQGAEERWQQTQLTKRSWLSGSWFHSKKGEPTLSRNELSRLRDAYPIIQGILEAAEQGQSLVLGNEPECRWVDTVGKERPGSLSRGDVTEQSRKQLGV